MVNPHAADAAAPAGATVKPRIGELDAMNCYLANMIEREP
jgi:hypothetical protein